MTKCTMACWLIVTLCIAITGITAEATATASPEKAQVVRTSEWEFTLISARRINVLKKQEVIGSQFDGTMYRGGRFVTSDVPPTNGAFLVVEIRAELLSEKGKPKEKTTGDPWKDAARAFRKYGERQPLVCNSNTSYVEDANGKKYSTLGSLREEYGTYYLQVVGVDLMGPSTFNLYFDIPKTTQSVKMRISNDVPLMDIEP